MPMEIEHTANYVVVRKSRDAHNVPFQVKVGDRVFAVESLLGRPAACFWLGWWLYRIVVRRQSLLFANLDVQQCVQRLRRGEIPWVSGQFWNASREVAPHGAQLTKVSSQ